MKTWNYRYNEAPDAKTALDKLKKAYAQQNPFRVAIIDKMMPDMNGEQLGRIIKENSEIKDTILIMMTAMGVRGEASRAENIGFSAYLTKPIKQSVLYECLLKVLSRDRDASEKKEQQIVTRHSVLEDRWRKRRILLAEDNITNQKVALAILKKLGLRADAVANGQEAVKALEATSYDLVLMDCQMPEMDGYAATHEIRRKESDTECIPRLEHIPIIAMTANALEGDKKKCLDAGMDDYISKPVDPQKLNETLEKWLVESDG